MLLFAILLSSLCVCVVSNNSPLFPKPLESSLIFVLDKKTIWNHNILFVFISSFSRVAVNWSNHLSCTKTQDPPSAACSALWLLGFISLVWIVLGLTSQNVTACHQLNKKISSMFLDDLMIERLSVHPEVTNVSCTRNIVGIIRRGKKAQWCVSVPSDNQRCVPVNGSHTGTDPCTTTTVVVRISCLLFLIPGLGLLTSIVNAGALSHRQTLETQFYFACIWAQSDFKVFACCLQVCNVWKGLETDWQSDRLIFALVFYNHILDLSQQKSIECVLFCCFAVYNFIITNKITHYFLSVINPQ